MPDMSGDASECVAAIIAILRSEFEVNHSVVDRSSARPHVSFTVLGKSYHIYLEDGFEEQYAAAPQTGELILSGLPQKLRASSAGTRAILVSRSGITQLPSSYFL
jgi:hypothetical protein